jgi:hypothetical protein
MRGAEIIGLFLLLAVVLLIIAVTVRRSLLSRSGGVDICWRTTTSADGKGWVFGQGRFDDRTLALYRSFSPLPLPSRMLSREELVLGGRRELRAAEPHLLPVGSIVLRCQDGKQQIELAASEQVLTGLRSWLESVPPQSHGINGRLREM